MFPLSGGVVRFPHMAFGNFASFTSGWITYVAVGTTAPIEVEAALQYGTQYADFTTKHVMGGAPVYTLTPLGYAAAVVLMAIFVVINYYGVRWFARINNALVSWKLFIILLVIVAFFVAAFHGDNFTQSRVHAFWLARRLHRHRHERDRLLLPRFPAGNRACRRDRQPEAQRAARGHRVGAHHGRHLHPPAGRLHRRARPGVAPARPAAGPTSRSRTTSARWPPSRRSSAWGGLRSCSTSTPSSPRATPVSSTPRSRHASPSPWPATATPPRPWPARATAARRSSGSSSPSSSGSSRSCRSRAGSSSSGSSPRPPCSRSPPGRSCWPRCASRCRTPSAPSVSRAGTPCRSSRSGAPTSSSTGRAGRPTGSSWSPCSSASSCSASSRPPGSCAASPSTSRPHCGCCRGWVR